MHGVAQRLGMLTADPAACLWLLASYLIRDSKWIAVYKPLAKGHQHYLSWFMIFLLLPIKISLTFTQLI